MKHSIKRIVALLLTAAMLFSLLPTVFAAEKTEEPRVLTEADYADVDALWDEIDEYEALYAKKGAGQKELADAAYEKVLASDNYVEGSIQRNGNTFTWLTEEGIRCIYDPYMREKKKNMVAPEESMPDGVYNEPTATKGGSPSGNQVYLVAPYYGYDSSFTDQYKNEASSIASAIGDTDGYTLYSGSSATVDKVATAISNGAVVIFDSHGTTDYSNGNDYVSGANYSYLCLKSNSGITSADYNDGCMYGSGYAYVNGETISNHMTSNSPGGILWMAICLGMATNTICNPMRNRGVEVVYGYSQSVTFAGDYVMEETFWDNLCAGETVADSIAAMKSKWGNWDWSTKIASYYGQSDGYSTISTARSNYAAFPVVVSDEDTHPGQRYYSSNYGACSLQTVKSTYTLFGDGGSGGGSSSSSITISFSCPSGVSASAINTTAGTAFTLPTPSGTPSANAYNYSFEGWVTSAVSDTTTEPTIYGAGESVSAQSSLTLYALYSYTSGGTTYYTTSLQNAAAQSITISFSCPTGVSASAINTTAGTTFTLPTPSGTPSADAYDYSFVGWATSTVSATTTAPTTYAAGNGVYANESLTLYAVYSYTSGGSTYYTTNLEYAAAESITISFSCPAGVSASAINTTAGTTFTLPTPSGTPNADAYNYSFVGWATSTVSATTTAPTTYAAGKNVSANESLTLYAVYSYTSGGSTYYTTNLEYASDDDDSGSTTTNPSYQLVDTSMTLTSGEYVILAESLGEYSSAAYYGVLNYADGSYQALPTVSTTLESVPTSITAGSSLAWTVTVSGSTMTFRNASGAYLTDATSTNVAVSLGSTAASWTVTRYNDNSVALKSSAGYYLSMRDDLNVTGDDGNPVVATASALSTDGSNGSCYFYLYRKVTGEESCAHSSTSVVNASAATCATAGYTGDTVCNACGETIAQGSTIPATGAHSYSNGYCTVCGAADPNASGSGDYEGRYYIAGIRSSGNYWYMSNDLGTASTKRYQAVDSGLTTLPGKITEPEAAYVFVLEKNADGTYRIYAEGISGTEKYLGHSSGNSGTLAAAASAVNATVDYANGVYNIHYTASDAERYLALNGTSGNNYFAWYKSGQKQDLILIPVEGDITVEPPAHEHSYSAVVTAPTCTTAGYTTYTCSCGDSYTGNQVAATGHSYSSAVTAPTCTAAGYTTYTCTDCGYSYTGNQVAATGHSYSSAVTAPTCVDAGYTTYTCSDCGYSYIGNEVAATGEHNYSNGYCTVCGAADPTVEEPGTEPSGDYEGRYYIASIRSSGNYWYMSNDLGTASTGRYQATDTGLTTLPGTITDPDAAYVFVLEKNADGTYRIYAEGISGTEKYLGHSSGNSGTLVDAASAVNATVDYADGVYNIHYTASDAERYLALNNTSGNNYFAWYKSGQKQNLVLIPVEGEATSEDPYLDSELVFYTKALGFDAYIGSQFAIYSKALPTEYTDFRVTFTHYKADGTVVDTVITEGTAVSVLEVFEYQTDASKMNDLIEVKLEGLRDGEWYHGEIVEWSVVQGVMNTLSAAAYDSNPERTTLLVDILLYGAAAQVNFDYNTDNLASDVLTAAELAYATYEPIALNDNSSETGSGTVKFVRKSLSLSSFIDQQFLISIGSLDVNDLEVRISYTVDGAAQQTVIDGADLTAIGSYYFFSFSELTPRQLRTVITLEVYDKTTDTLVSPSVDFSAESFACQVVTANTDANLVALCKAMMCYCDAAAAYFG